MKYPIKIDHVHVPPLKIQGIKTKLVPFIAQSIIWDGNGTFFEPFLGSGVVGFNLQPEHAIFSDINPYVIQFYKDIQTGKITPEKVRSFLELEGQKLEETGDGKDSYYYEVRDRFNKNHDSLDFLFLQRSNFNGMMRFNNKGDYNVPFGRKPHRFRKALITKIVNQVEWIQSLMKGKDWKFICMPFEEAFQMMKPGDFAYLDPPYIGRSDEYFCPWDEEKADLLADLATNGPANYALSMWGENKYRKNDHLLKWSSGELLSKEHFYHFGGKESNRNAITEVLVISPESCYKGDYSALKTISDFRAIHKILRK